MNQMIAALQKSRSAAPDAEPSLGGPAAPEAPEGGPGDAMLEKLAGIDSKLDAILKVLGAEQQTAAAPEEIEAKGELTE